MSINLNLLCDADAAARDLVAQMRARITVADAAATRRATIVTGYFSASDERERLRLAAEAVRYDAAHPDEAPLFDELYGASLAEVA